MLQLIIGIFLLIGALGTWGRARRASAEEYPSVSADVFMAWRRRVMDLCWLYIVGGIVSYFLIPLILGMIVGAILSATEKPVESDTLWLGAGVAALTTIVVFTTLGVLCLIGLQMLLRRGPRPAGEGETQQERWMKYGANVVIASVVVVLLAVPVQKQSGS